jgi:phospholipase C
VRQSRCAARCDAAVAAASELPAPDASGIDHIVVVMMENRSFDHYLGWVRRC